MTKTIDLIYFNAGGGHRAAAQALDAVIAQQQRPWRVRCINLVDVLDPQASFRRLTGMAPEDLYNKRLAKGWTLGLAQELKLLQGVIRMGHNALVQRLRAHWLQARPDMVVSLIPNFNRALCCSLQPALPGGAQGGRPVPFVTVLTDMADHPPNFWIEPDLPQHLVCGSALAVDQALAAGCAPARIHRTSGMVLRPDFYAPLVQDRQAERARLGLHPDRPTAVVMFGGQGSMAMLTIARQLPDVQLLLLCGHHSTLAEKLRSLQPSAPHAVVGFTAQVRQHLALGDFFIGKPGPGSLSEAVQQGLPVVTLRNAWTMPQERYNTDWVQATGVGLVGTSARNIRPVVLALMARLGEFQARVQQVHNRAIFEVPEILADILANPSGLRLPAPAATADSTRPASLVG